MQINFEYKPLDIHEPFHKSTAYERMCFGAMGSGKTYATVAEAIAWCLEQPGIEGAIIRKTVPELKRSTEPVFMRLLPAELWALGKKTRNGGHLESFTFPNGSLLWFLSMDDWNKHRSMNLGFLCYDEANEIDLDSYLGMRTRVRQKDITAMARDAGYTHQITRRGIWGATNPNGKDWLYYYFHPDSPQRKDGAEMFTSTTLDNPFLPLDFVADMLALPKHYVRRYVLCQFDDFAGLIYEDWGYDTHVLQENPFTGWTETQLAGRTFWMACDPGTDAPTAGLWVWCDDENNRLVGVAEYEQPGLSVPQHTRAWKMLEAKHRARVRWRVGDPNAITKRDAGTMLGLDTQFAQQGYHFNLGSNDRDARITSLASLITSRRFVLTKDCPLTFEALKNYQWKDLTPAQKASGEEGIQKPLKKNTHLVECAQYLSQRKVPGLTKQRLEAAEKTFNDELLDGVRAHVKRNAKRNRQRRRGAGDVAILG